MTRDGGEGRTTLTRAGRVRIDYRLDATGDRDPSPCPRVDGPHRAGGGRRRDRGDRRRRPLRHDARGGDEAGRFEAFLARLARIDFAPNRAAVFSAHQMGTVRMGADPARSRRDRAGPRPADRAARSSAGLYVADSSTVPDGDRGQPDAHRDDDGPARRPDGSGRGARLRAEGRGTGADRPPWRRHRRSATRRPGPAAKVAAGRGRGSARPPAPPSRAIRSAGGHDHRDRDDDHRRGHERPRRDRLGEDEAAEGDRHDRVDVGVRADERAAARRGAARRRR